MAGNLAIQDGDEHNSDGHSLPVSARNGQATRSKKTRVTQLVDSPPEDAMPPQPMAGQSPVTHSHLDSLIEAVTRTLSNSALMPEQIDRLFVYQRDLLDRQARTAYAEALARMQPELPIIHERGGIRNRVGGIQSRYALWEDIVGIITPILARHGFSLTFRTGSAAELVEVIGVLTHIGGHEERTSLTLPLDVGHPNNPRSLVQAIGSSTSYGKRYTASALLNLRSGTSEDDDGAGTSAPERITAEQAAELAALIEATNANRTAMLEWLKVPSLEAIPSAKFDAVKARLEAKRK